MPDHRVVDDVDVLEEEEEDDFRKCHSEELITTATEAYFEGTSRRKRWRFDVSRVCRVGSRRRQPTHLGRRREKAVNNR